MLCPDRTNIHLWRCLMGRVKLFRFHQGINIEGDVRMSIADAQYCLQDSASAPR